MILDRRACPLRSPSDRRFEGAEPGATRGDLCRLPGCACIGVGAADVAEIEQLNIYWATMLAMQRAVAALACPPEFALVDGKGAPALPCRVRCVVGGDALSLSVAAASIVAKVTRDRLTRCPRLPRVWLRAARRLRHPRASGGAAPARPDAAPPHGLPLRARGPLAALVVV